MEIFRHINNPVPDASPMSVPQKQACALPSPHLALPLSDALFKCVQKLRGFCHLMSFECSTSKS